jgi:hypothetical protein
MSDEEVWRIGEVVARIGGVAVNWKGNKGRGGRQEPPAEMLGSSNCPNINNGSSRSSFCDQDPGSSFHHLLFTQRVSTSCLFSKIAAVPKGLLDSC